MHFAHLANTMLRDEERKKVHETIMFLLVLCQIFIDLKKFTDRLSNKPFLI